MTSPDPIRNWKLVRESNCEACIGSLSVESNDFLSRVRIRRGTQMGPEVLPSNDGGDVHSLLPPLLAQVYEEMVRRPPRLEKVKDHLESLLRFLCSDAGRTHANCLETERYFVQRFDWPVVWAQIPESYASLLDDIGSLLHDAVAAPEIAENFDSTPEQLLNRARALLTEKA